MAQSKIEGDVRVTGNISCSTLTIPAGSVRNASIEEDAEIEAVVRRLAEAGVRVTAIHCNDQMHGVLSQGRMVPAGDVLTEGLSRTLALELHRSAPPLSSNPTAGQAGQTKETT